MNAKSEAIIKLDSLQGQVTVRIVRTVTIRDNVAYADGYNVPLGREIYDLVEIDLDRNGVRIVHSTYPPEVITQEQYRGSYAKLHAAGAYARLGDGYISEMAYSAITAELEKLDAEITAQATPEYWEIKADAAERAAAAERSLEREATEYAHALKSGLCPKCGTYCYGDCEANS